MGLKGKITSELPNNAIYKFEGFMDIDKESVSLGADNFVLRGCKLRNTGHIYGIIVFTGPESKIM